jgi:hypothetical protein
MQSLQSVLFECRDADGSKVFKLEDRLNVKIEHGRKKSWQTIVKRIRVAVSRVVAKRPRAVKAMDKIPAADKASRVASKVASVAKVVAKRVVSRATANFQRSEEVSSIGLTSHCAVERQ